MQIQRREFDFRDSFVAPPQLSDASMQNISAVAAQVHDVIAIMGCLGRIHCNMFMTSYRLYEQQSSCWTSSYTELLQHPGSLFLCLLILSQQITLRIGLRTLLAANDIQHRVKCAITKWIYSSISFVSWILKTNAYAWSSELTSWQCLNIFFCRYRCLRNWQRLWIHINTGRSTYISIFSLWCQYVCCQYYGFRILPILWKDIHNRPFTEQTIIMSCGGAIY